METRLIVMPLPLAELAAAFRFTTKVFFRIGHKVIFAARRAVESMIEGMEIAAGQFSFNNVSWTTVFGMKRNAAYRLARQ